MLTALVTFRNADRYNTANCDDLYLPVVIDMCYDNSPDVRYLTDSVPSILPSSRLRMLELMGRRLRLRRLTTGVGM